MTRKSLIVTGASTGIGAATARLAAREGYDVAIGYRSNHGAASEVARDVEGAGGRAVLIQADFTEAGVDDQLIEALGGRPDLVLSDMAHNTIGHRQTDHLKIIALIEIAADFAIRTLKPGGAFVTKNFQGGDAGGVLAQLRAEFEDVKFVKPGASRKDSSEVYLVATGKR